MLRRNFLHLFGVVPFFGAVALEKPRTNAQHLADRLAARLSDMKIKEPVWSTGDYQTGSVQSKHFTEDHLFQLERWVRESNVTQFMVPKGNGQLAYSGNVVLMLEQGRVSVAWR